MKGEWCYFKNHFTPDECNRIIEDGLKIKPHDAQVGVTGLNQSQDQKNRRSQIRFIEKKNPDFVWLFDRVWKMALRANEEWFDFHITKMDYIQLAEYDESYLGEYKDHHDVFWINKDPYYHRKLSAVIQLTDDKLYEGGNLELLQLLQNPNPVDMRQQGTTIFFPSFFLHRATPVTKGRRYSLACWFDGPKWR
jgi:PKHD-type hydroxylase